MRKLVGWIVLFPLLSVGCSSSESSPTPDSGLADTGVADSTPTDSSPTDGARDGVSEVASDAADTGAVDSGPPIATKCDVVGPTLPALTYAILFVDDMGKGMPIPTGGAATGTWLMKKITLYLKPAAKGLFDPDKSSLAGQGFFGLDTTGKYKSLFDLDVTLSTSIAGEVKQGSKTKSFGTWESASDTIDGKTVAGAKLKFNPECAETTADPGTTGREFGWSLVDPTHALIFPKPATSGAGAGFVQGTVIEAEKAP